GGRSCADDVEIWTRGSNMARSEMWPWGSDADGSKVMPLDPAR
ncbi:unnamed protein product, partial [Urochloa humidicola]